MEFSWQRIKCILIHLRDAERGGERGRIAAGTDVRASYVRIPYARRTARVDLGRLWEACRQVVNR